MIVCGLVDWWRRAARLVSFPVATRQIPCITRAISARRALECRVPDSISSPETQYEMDGRLHQRMTMAPVSRDSGRHPDLLIRRIAPNALQERCPMGTSRPIAVRGTWHWSIPLALVFLASAAEAETALSGDAAQMRLDRTSRALSAADHGVDAAKTGADAMRMLHRPIVTASAQYLVSEKTLSVDLAGAKGNALGNTQDFLAAFPGSEPPAFQQIASTGRLSQALPGVFDEIPDQFSYRFRDEVFRPIVQSMLLYTGGAFLARRARRRPWDRARARRNRPFAHRRRDYRLQRQDVRSRSRDRLRLGSLGQHRALYAGGTAGVRQPLGRHCAVRRGHRPMAYF